MSTFERIALEDFAPKLGVTSTEVSSVALGGRIVSCSDEWFAPASDLLKVAPAASMKGQFGPTGALFDGWETRRHNPDPYDWVIVRLGPQAGASLTGFDVDTANFNGNEAPAVEIFGLHLTLKEEQAGKLSEIDSRWTSLVTESPCGPSSRHLFLLNKPTQTLTHVKLHMIPDGGIGRFRVYGTIPPPGLGLGLGEESGESPPLNRLDLAHVMNGGRVIFTSDQHFGQGSNVLLPGRGKDMGDGWETKRSRGKDHKDFLVIQLGEAGLLDYVEIDTAHFLGNYPAAVQVHGAEQMSSKWPADGESGIEWVELVPKTKMGPGKQHFLALQNATGRSFSHIKVSMLPDGGIKRVRVVGRRAKPVLDAGLASKLPAPKIPKELPTLSRQESKITNSSAEEKGVGFSAGATKAAPLTSQDFSAYGDVIGLPTTNAKTLDVNQGTAKKYVSQSRVESLYEKLEGKKAESFIHLYHCSPLSLPFEVKVLERHRFTPQAFLPMTHGTGQGGFLVIVALNGKDDKPDLSTLKAFHAKTTQGISYHPGVWHHPMVALGSVPTSFACVVSESKEAPELNCDEVFYDKAVATYAI